MSKFKIVVIRFWDGENNWQPMTALFILDKDHQGLTPLFRKIVDEYKFAHFYDSIPGYFRSMKEAFSHTIFGMWLRYFVISPKDNYLKGYYSIKPDPIAKLHIRSDNFKEPNDIAKFCLEHQAPFLEEN